MFGFASKKTLRRIVVGAALASIALATPADARPGTPVWTQRYVHVTGTVNTGGATTIDRSPDGSKVFVTGNSYSEGHGYDFATIAYNASTGAPLWTRRYDGPAHSDDGPSALRLSPDGTKVYVTGSSARTTTDLDFMTIAYDATTGSMLWSRRTHRLGSDLATGLGVGTDGTRLFVTGVTGDNLACFTCDYLTVAYNAADGNPVWSRTYSGPGNGMDIPTGLVVSANNARVIVTGRSNGGTSAGFDFATVAYSGATGAVAWTRRYNGPASRFDGATALGVSPDGTKVFVTGNSDGGPATGDDYVTFAYSAASGGTLWGRRYNGGVLVPTPQPTADTPSALGVSPDGSKVVVTGHIVTAAPNPPASLTQAYNSTTGAVVWTSRAHGPENPAAIAMNPSATQVYVTGSRQDATSGYDYATAAYSALNGSVLWSARYAGNSIASRDTTRAIVVAPKGNRVYVTGQTGTDAGGSTMEGWATLAYATS